MKFQDLTRLHNSIRKELDEAFDRVIKNSSFIQGPEVLAFEKEFAEFTRAPFCLGVSNGTDALEVSLEALGIGAGKKVLVPSLTFAATAEAVVRAGAEPVFVDVDKDTFCLTPEILKSFIKNYSGKLNAIIVVHLYGRACEMTEICKIAKDHDLKVIEDCAQAHGAFIDEKHVGLHGDIGTFSFYPGKNLGALGDAGAIITNSKDLNDKVKMLRDHGRTEKYLHQSVGRNARMDGLQAAFLRVKLAKLSEWTEQRRELADLYYKKFENISEIELLSKPKDIKSHAFHLFVIKIKDIKKYPREKLINFLKNKSIETIIQYPLGLHEQPAYKQYFSQQNFQKCETTSIAAKQILSVPFDPLMDEEDIAKVVSEVKNFFNTESDQ